MAGSGIWHELMGISDLWSVTPWGQAAIFRECLGWNGFSFLRANSPEHMETRDRGGGQGPVARGSSVDSSWIPKKTTSSCPQDSSCLFSLPPNQAVSQ